MISDAVKRAIVQVLDGDGRTVLGTGFLIADGGIVLTAKHVVGDRRTASVRFGDAAPMAAAWLEGGGERDWALLRIERASDIPEGVAPIPWSPLEGISEAMWFSFGHAALYGGLGGGFHGKVVVAAADVLDLFCEQLASASYAEARGLSGGPCVVEGEAAGLIVEVLHEQKAGTWNGRIIAGQVVALPLAAFAGETKWLPDELTALPWQREFTGAIEGLAPALHGVAAEAAAIKNPIAGRRLPRRIARQMIRGRIERTARVVVDVGRSLAREIACDLMKRAEALWVAPEAAAHLATIATADAPPVGLLATDYGWSAEHHFLRAAEHHRAAAPPAGGRRWSHVLVQDVHAEPFVEAALEALRHALDPRGGDPKRIARRFERERVVAFIACPPRQDLIERVRAEWPGLVVIFLSRAVSSGGAPGVVAVTPPPASDDEARAWEAKLSAWESVDLVGVRESDAQERSAS